MVNEKRFGVLTASQAETFRIYANHFGVSLDELQSLEGRALNVMCYELAKQLAICLWANFLYEEVGDLARGYKALAYGGSI